VSLADRGVIAHDISRALSCAQNKLCPEGDGCSDANGLRLIPCILTWRSSPWAQLSLQVGVFVQALDVYAILLRDLVACAAQSLRELPPNAQNLTRGAAGAYWGGRPVERDCGPSLRIHI
jgi:hypothetical protein